MSRCVRGSGLGWCVYPTRGDSARAGRALWRHKNGEYAAVTRGRPAFQWHEAHAEDSDTTPTRKRRKCKTGVLSPPPTGLPPKPSEAVSVGRRRCSGVSESCRLRRDEGFVVRSDDGQHRICLVCGEAAALPNALGGAKPHTPKLRAEAHTHQAASVSAETLLPASGGAASKGGQSPFEEPPALRGDERNHFRKVTDYEKRY